MLQPEKYPLWDLTAASGLSSRRLFSQRDGHVALGDLGDRGTRGARLALTRGKSVLISSQQQLPVVLALLQLDGVARRVLLCPPDLSPMHVPAVIAEAEVNVIVSDGTGPAGQSSAREGGLDLPVVSLGFDCLPGPASNQPRCVTEWLLFTSGTTGRPKIVVHTLASLTGPLDDDLAVANDAVWSTFYDIRRYGGLQILLRALLGGGSMVLSQGNETIADFLVRAAGCGVTHISGTPSHWRLALMSPAVKKLNPAYVRLSGEVADQAILNHLATAFPKAEIAHAFASTEAGVAFDVRDGQAGFPTALIGQVGGKADMRVQDGSLRIRSARTASRYLGDSSTLADADGFVDTGDMVEARGDRYYFVGRREGIINVGGQKVHPEEIESAINQHSAVLMSRVRGQRNPITGAIVVAEVVLRPTADQISFETIKAEILAFCRGMLPPHKVPVMLHEVAALDVAASGKLVRGNA